MEPLNATTAALPLAESNSITSRYSPSYLSYTLLAVILTLLATRILSSLSVRPQITSNGALTVPSVPYNLPLIGHLSNMAWDAPAFTKALRSTYTKGIFALNFGGTRHNVMYAPALSTALLNHRDGKASSERVAKEILIKVFGLPRAEMPKYEAAWEDLLDCYKAVLSEPGLGNMVAKTAREIQENVLFLVSSASSIVDQTRWERVSDVSLTKDESGEDVVEASMLPLIKDFCAQTANSSIMGTSFLANYPDFFEDVWTLDRAILLLIAGLPRWVPIPSVTRAHIARRKILESLDTFHSAMEKEADGQDPGAEWRDLDDVGDLVKARMQVYRKHNFSIRARAATEHSLLWAANANSNVLVFWMLNHIYADKDLLALLREEIAPHVRVVQPKQELAVPELPRFEAFDVDALCTQCPLLKACYIETLRLDTSVWSLKVVHDDFVLQTRERDSQGWLLRKGEYAHAAHDLHHTDPAYFPEPMEWKPERHIKYKDDEGGKRKGTADMGSIRPYGGGSSMCKGRAFALKESMAFTAAIVALWEMEPAGGGEWKMPKPKRATGVYTTQDDVRVWLRRRKLPLAA